MLNSSQAEGATPAEPNTIEVKQPKPRRGRWIILGFILAILIIAAGAYQGYRTGIQQRLDKQTSEITLKATDQFQRGLLDMKAGNFELARKRFEYVLQLDPNFPGAMQKLTEAMVAMNRTATPTFAPTSTPTKAPEQTPTIDTRGAEQLFNQAKQQLDNKEWQNSLDTLEALRQNNKEYRTVEVDGMYYIDLRNLGVRKILIDGELEQGIYDLALAERFGPIDAEADSYRTWAHYYITGASFWQVDWSQVVFYFAQVYPALPNLHNGGNSGMTATERFRQASIYYGDKLAASGDFCKAKEQYANALSLSANPALEPTATYVADKCGQATATPAPQP